MFKCVLADTRLSCITCIEATQVGCLSAVWCTSKQIICVNLGPTDH